MRVGPFGERRPPQPAVIDNDMAAFLDMQLVTVKKPDAHKLFRNSLCHYTADHLAGERLPGGTGSVAAHGLNPANHGHQAFLSHVAGRNVALLGECQPLVGRHLAVRRNRRSGNEV